MAYQLKLKTNKKFKEENKWEWVETDEQINFCPFYELLYNLIEDKGEDDEKKEDKR